MKQYFEFNSSGYHYNSPIDELIDEEGQNS